MPAKDTYTTVTSGGKATKTTGYLCDVIAAAKARRTAVAVYCGGLLVCAVCGREVTFAIG